MSSLAAVNRTVNSWRQLQLNWQDCPGGATTRSSSGTEANFFFVGCNFGLVSATTCRSFRVFFLKRICPNHGSLLDWRFLNLFTCWKGNAPRSMAPKVAGSPWNKAPRRWGCLVVWWFSGEAPWMGLGSKVGSIPKPQC